MSQDSTIATTSITNSGCIDTTGLYYILIKFKLF